MLALGDFVPGDDFELDFGERACLGDLEPPRLVLDLLLLEDLGDLATLLAGLLGDFIEDLPAALSLDLALEAGEPGGDLRWLEVLGERETLLVIEAFEAWLGIWPGDLFDLLLFFDWVDLKADCGVTLLALGVVEATVELTALLTVGACKSYESRLLLPPLPPLLTTLFGWLVLIGRPVLVV